MEHLTCRLIGAARMPLYRKILCLNVGLTLATVAVIAFLRRISWSEFVLASLAHAVIQAAIVTLVFMVIERKISRAPGPPLGLLDAYLKVARAWLPPSQRDDILNELAENIHSQIDDREATLRRPLSEEEVGDILRRHGHPIQVAGAYWQGRGNLSFGERLIGPELFQFYLRTLAVNLVDNVAIIVAVQVAQGVLDFSKFFLPVIIQVGCVTLLFILLEVVRSKWPDAIYKWDSGGSDETN